MKGITPQRWDNREGVPGAADLIRQALASDDDYQALAIIAASGKGIHRFGPAMGSVLLAACRPAKFTIADTRVLKALRALGLMPDGHPSFQMDDWQPYLSLDPPMILKAGSRSPRSDPGYPFQQAALTRCSRQQRQSGH
jgi:hypothetical protein